MASSRQNYAENLSLLNMLNALANQTAERRSFRNYVVHIAKGYGHTIPGQPVQQPFGIRDGKARVRNVVLLRAEMQNELSPRLRSQIERHKIFRRAETRRVPLAALRDACVSVEDDAAQRNDLLLCSGIKRRKKCRDIFGR